MHKKKKKRPKGRYRLCPKGDAVVQETGLWVISVIESTLSHFPFSSWNLMGFLLGCLEVSEINSVHIAVPEWVNPLWHLWAFTVQTFTNFSTNYTSSSGSPNNSTLSWPQKIHLWGFPGGDSGKESSCQCRRLKRCRLDPWVGKIPWRRTWQPTPLFLPGESNRQRSLAGYSVKSQTGLKQLSTHTNFHLQRWKVVWS